MMFIYGFTSSHFGIGESVLTASLTSRKNGGLRNDKGLLLFKMYKLQKGAEVA